MGTRLDLQEALKASSRDGLVGQQSARRLWRTSIWLGVFERMRKGQIDGPLVNKSSSFEEQWRSRPRWRAPPEAMKRAGRCARRPLAALPLLDRRRDVICPFAGHGSELAGADVEARNRRNSGRRL